MTLRLLLAITVFLGALGSAPQARAQKLPFSLMMSPELMVSSDFLQARDPALRLDAPDPELYRTERRQRMLLAAGIGAVTAAVLNVAGTAAWGCKGDRHRTVSPLAAGAIGMVGMSFAIGGGFALRRSSQDAWYPATRGQKTAAVLTAIGVAGTTTALLAALSAAEGAGTCAN